MKHFTSAHDVQDIQGLIKLAEQAKANPLQWAELGKNKTIGLFFMNASLRTRLSTQQAAENLGLRVMVVNLNQEGWALEFEDGVVMDGTKPEHIKEAAAVVGQYCHIIGVRSFPLLADRASDYAETVLNGFIKYSGRPVVSMESSLGHPLQALADSLTIKELWQQHADFGKRKPKVVMSWAPHVRALPQCVPNSFAQWLSMQDVELVIANPEGYDLDTKFTGSTYVLHDQDEAFKGADFVYAKNWSSVAQYGQVLKSDYDWMITNQKLALTNNAKLMHCLPTRRNVEIADEVLDGPHSVVIQQAGNRVPAAQAVLHELLKHNYPLY